MRETPLSPLLLTTESLPSGGQFAAWRGWFAPTVELAVPSGSGHGYAARLMAWRLGPFALSVETSPATIYRRTREQTRRDSLDHWVVGLARRGTHAMRAGGGLFTAPTGLPYVSSLADACDGQRSVTDCLCLFVPRDAFPELGPTIDRCRYTALGGGMGMLLASYLSSLADRLPDMAADEVPRLVAATRSMVAAGLAPSDRTREAAQDQLQQTRLERVRQVVRKHLRSPMLTPGRLCRLAGVSRTQLYRMFEASGGVAAYIQAERLREAHRALTDPDDHRTIHQVAEDVAFFDPSGFSRTFRRTFGCTPSEVRLSAWSGGVNVPVHRPAASPTGAGYAAFLRQLSPYP